MPPSHAARGFCLKATVSFEVGSHLQKLFVLKFLTIKTNNHCIELMLRTYPLAIVMKELHLYILLSFFNAPPKPPPGAVAGYRHSGVVTHSVSHSPHATGCADRTDQGAAKGTQKWSPKEKKGSDGVKKGNIFWLQQAMWWAWGTCGDSLTCVIRMEEVSTNTVCIP